MVALDATQREDLAITAYLVIRACLKEPISKGTRKPLILHTVKSNACVRPRWRASWRGSSCSYPSPSQGCRRTSYSDSLFRTNKYRPYYPNPRFTGDDAACQWQVSFIEWYSHRDRYRENKFEKPYLHHGSRAVVVCHFRAVILKQARKRHQRQ